MPQQDNDLDIKTLNGDIAEFRLYAKKQKEKMTRINLEVKRLQLDRDRKLRAKDGCRIRRRKVTPFPIIEKPSIKRARKDRLQRFKTKIAVEDAVKQALEEAKVILLDDKPKDEDDAELASMVDDFKITDGDEEQGEQPDDLEEEIEMALDDAVEL